MRNPGPGSARGEQCAVTRQSIDSSCGQGLEFDVVSSETNEATGNGAMTPRPRFSVAAVIKMPPGSEAERYLIEQRARRAPGERPTIADLRAAEALLTPAEKAALAAECAAAIAKVKQWADPGAILKALHCATLPAMAAEFEKTYSLAAMAAAFEEKHSIAAIIAKLAPWDALYQQVRYGDLCAARIAERCMRLEWRSVSVRSRCGRRSRATRRTSGNSSPPADDGDGPAPSAEQHPLLLAVRFPCSTPSSYQFFRPHAAPGAPLRSAGGACFSPER